MFVLARQVSATVYTRELEVLKTSPQNCSTNMVGIVNDLGIHEESWKLTLVCVLMRVITCMAQWC